MCGGAIALIWGGGRKRILSRYNCVYRVWVLNSGFCVIEFVAELWDLASSQTHTNQIGANCSPAKDATSNRNILLGRTNLHI